MTGRIGLAGVADYPALLDTLKARMRSARLIAAVAITQELIQLYGAAGATRAATSQPPIPIRNLCSKLLQNCLGAVTAPCPSLRPSRAILSRADAP
ncbi:MAG: hypothetical protein KKC14_09115 [Alphaproteobacteria bacterium]|nr:hypothetical protein [Alphaproteobacteria bacterium]